MFLSWLIALQQIFFLHSNHFEQISQIQTSISCSKIGDEDDVDGPMKDKRRRVVGWAWKSGPFRKSTLPWALLSLPHFPTNAIAILFLPVRKRFCDIIQSEHFEFQVKS